MKLTCVTAVFNAIKSGNRENLIRCVRSVAALKTEHEHLIYDGGSTDGTVELLRELESEVNGEGIGVGGESRWTKDGVREITSSWFDIADTAAIEGMACISVSGEENPLTDRRAIKDVFQSFGVVENDADGRHVIFPARSAGKMLGQSGIDIRRYVRSFADMFRRSIRAWSEKEAVIESHKQHRNITAYHQYIVKADLAGAICYVRFTVREDAGGKVKRNEVHSSTISRVTVYKAKGAELSGLGHAQVEDSTPFVDNKIAFFLKGVKGGKTLRVVSEPDTGIYNALNKGVRDAKGEWFYVLGCDDYICHPEVMDRLIAEAGDAEIICTDVYLGHVRDNKIRHVDLNAVLWHTPYCHQGVLMRSRAIWKCHGFDECYRIAADYKLLLQCHLAGSFIRCRCGLEHVFASFSMCGMSESNRKRMDQEFDQVVAELLNLRIEKLPVYRERRYLPVISIFRFLFSGDDGLRISSRAMFRVAVRRYLRIIFFPVVIITRPIRHRKNRKVSGK